MLTFLKKLWNLIYRRKQRKKIEKFFSYKEYYRDYPVLPPVDENKTPEENMWVLKKWIQECQEFKKKKTLESEKL